MSSSRSVEMALPSLMTPLMYSKCSGGSASFIASNIVLASSVGRMDLALLVEPLGRPRPRLCGSPGATDSTTSGRVTPRCLWEPGVVGCEPSVLRGCAR